MSVECFNLLKFGELGTSQNSTPGNGMENQISHRKSI